MRSNFKKNSILFLFFGLLSVQANAQSDSLDNYIQRLKISKASGGNETAFLSIGSDFLYAQEYFEAGNYSSAAYSFEAVLRKDKDHPYANYQMAIALIKQKDSYKTQQAKLHLSTSFKAQPSLRARYEKEKPGEVKTKPQTQTKQVYAKGLDTYIEQIKYSRSTNGAATAMLTSGLNAFYGIEYFEDGNYQSAEIEFALSLLKDSSNPYVNYLIAVSMAAQGKTNEAKPFLAKSVATDPGLAEHINADIISVQKNWKQKQDAKIVKTSTPIAVGKYGGKLVFGNYTCHVFIWNGPNKSPAYRQDYKGYFSLKKDFTYQWLDNGATGRFTYNATTGQVSWPSGYFKDFQPILSKFKIDGNYANITIEMTNNYRWECGCKL